MLGFVCICTYIAGCGKDMRIDRIYQYADHAHIENICAYGVNRNRIYAHIRMKPHNPQPHAQL